MQKSFYCVLAYIITMNIIYTTQEQIYINARLSTWNNSKLCIHPFNRSNNQWSIDTCGTNKGIEFCQLTSEYFPVNKINEIIMSFRVNMTRNSKPLYLFSKRQINTNDFNKMYLNRIDRTYISGKHEYESIDIEWRIDMENYKGITLEFRDHEGFCGTISNLKLSYYMCDQQEHNLVVYPAQPAPSKNPQQRINIPGKCKRHAVRYRSKMLYKTCDWLGRTKKTGKCVCYPGFTKAKNNCLLCDEGTYKPRIGNRECRICGGNSTSTADRQSCSCESGFFREDRFRKNSNKACHDARPRDLLFAPVTQTSVNISWTAPSLRLEAGNVTFTISCDNCWDSEGHFPHTTTKNFVKIDHLNTNKVYFIYVKAKYSDVDHKELFVHGSFRTLKYLIVQAVPTSDNRNMILTITMCAALLILLIVILVTLYIMHKRKTTHFLSRINSLKKARRPPPPPVPPTPTPYDENVNDDIDDGINPYAVFIPLQIPQLDTDEESTDEVSPHYEKKCYTNGWFTNVATATINEDSEGYMCMSAGLKDKHSRAPQRASNHYTNSLHLENLYKQQRYLPQCPPVQRIRTHSCLFQNTNDYNGPNLTVEMRVCAPAGRVRTQSCWQDTADIDTSIHNNNIQTQINPLDLNPLDLERRSRAQSCYFRDSTGYELTFKQIEKAKLTNKYKSKDCLVPASSVPRRPHSADDVNKLHGIL